MSGQSIKEDNNPKENDEVFNRPLELNQEPVSIEARKGWILKIIVEVPEEYDEAHPLFDLIVTREDSPGESFKPLLEMLGRRYIDTCIKFDKDETVYFHLKREEDPVLLNLRLIWIGPDKDEPDLVCAPKGIKELWDKISK